MNNNIFSAVLLSAGSGRRTGRKTPKQYLQIAGKPIIMHSIEKLASIDNIGEIVIVAAEDYFDFINNLIHRFNIIKPITLVKGGSTRQESACLGIKNASFDRILLHEAARPFVKREDFLELINADCNCAIFGIELPFTVNLRNGDLLTTVLERDTLVNVQLPQKFPRDVLLNAHDYAAREGRFYNEDAGLVMEATGESVKILPGQHYNIKITDSVDVECGEIIYKHFILG
jgi:2-C-methyl-D-erythritol 4-phosphate cytidylyltransferase